jgi:hypothetical protein
MGDLYLNALPLSLGADADTIIGRVWERDDDVDAELREDPGRGHDYHHYSFNKESYAWPAPEGALPAECRDRGEDVALGELPASVLAFAAREAAVRRLLAEGFELRGGVGGLARLSRRKFNLATAVLRKLPDGVGAFAAVAVYGLSLGYFTEPGDVALVVEQWVEHVLDVPLAELARTGIELIGARVRWQHRLGCDCDPAERVGHAGRVISGDPSGELTLLDGGGEQMMVPAACLRVHASAWMMARYLASTSGRGERDLAEALREETLKFSKTRKRWENLEATARALGELDLFENVSATLGQPLLVPTRSTTDEHHGPVALPAAAEGELNFQYGTPKLAASAAQGLRRHGPYDEGQPRSDILKAVVVAPEAFEADARKLRRILTDGIERFEGVKERYRLREFEADMQLFPDATRAGYENAVLNAAKSGVDIVFFVTKRDFRYAPRGQNPYLAAKAALASAGIPSQAVTVETLNQPDSSLQWSSDSVALAAYTKVGNIPYVLHAPVGSRELVLGVGRTDVFDPEKGGLRQRYGSSVAVRQDGDFLFAGSTTPVSTEEDYETHLARLLTDQIARFVEQQGAELDRLIIYLFKRTGKRELWAIRRAIGKRNIEFALLHINRDSPLWLVERNGSSITSPERGTMVELDSHDRLLVTGDPKKANAGHPLRLTLDRKSTYHDMNRLAEQAYGFTKTSYRGFLQSNEPSPILFGRLLAQKVEQLVPYGFNPATAAGPLGDNLWFI